MASIFCIGDLCIDHYPDLFQSYIGGCSYNVAKHLNDFKSNVTLVAPTGMDKWTGLITSKLEESGISHQLLKRKESNLVLNIKVIEGERHFEEFQDEILRSFSWESDELKSLEIADYIVCPYFEEIRPFVNRIVELYGDRVILDLHDCVNLSLNEISHLLERVNFIHVGDCSYKDEDFESLTKSTKKMISRTLGKEGSLLYSSEKTYRSNACDVIDVVDSIGAGDAYLARFVYGLVNGEPIQPLLDYSNEFAASTLSHNGATKRSRL